ncbi:hypothetical protein G3A_03020 [Bacillus sp. 17376]|nr:hypothetical protein G3A_03020 [Bacillus sp. 17376]
MKSTGKAPPFPPAKFDKEETKKSRNQGEHERFQRVPLLKDERAKHTLWLLTETALSMGRL